MDNTTGLPRKITFEHPYDDSNETDLDPYILLANPEDDLAAILNGDEIVTPETFQIKFSYPLSCPMTIKLVDGPYTRRELARFICDTYARIYKEEEESTTVPVGNEFTNCLNRNETNGKYGIWGHDLCDLVLHTVYARKDSNGTLYELGIDS